MKHLNSLIRASSACFLAWLCLGLLFIACGVRAQITPSLLNAPVIPLVTSIPQPPSADPLKIALGERLFDDPHLSRNGERACSSCHEVGTNGATNRQFDTSLEGSKLPFNTQTIFNAALSFPQMGLDGNVQSLDQQIEAAISAPEFMGSSVAGALRSIKTENGMVRQFIKVYGHGPDRDSLLDAISTYERSLLTPGSPFDRWLSGDAKALSPEQVLGYQQFKSLGCISCHQGVNVGGNLYEKSGVFHDLVSSKPQILRVPSLRNVAVTAPYFHDGSVPNLPKAVRDMGYAQLDRNLSSDEVNAIVAFLQSLTGYYQGKKLAPPP